jgi:hypothetical protein
MPIHLSTLDKLAVALVHLKAQFSNNPVVRDATLSQRADALLDLRTRQHVESFKDYPGWSSKFNAASRMAECPRLGRGISKRATLNWIVRNAFNHNMGLSIDLISFRRWPARRPETRRMAPQRQFEHSVDRITRWRPHPPWIRPES